MLFALSLFASAGTAYGHGFMVTPTIRNIRGPGSFRYEPQSLGAVGPGGEITICGKGKAINHQPKVDKVVKMPAPGSEFKFEAKITAHHKGHMIVRVCPFINGNTGYGDLKKCLRVSGKEGKKTWPLSAGTGTKEWVAVLPSKAELEALNSPKGVFTIQWRYNTANSCTNPSESLSDDSNCREEKCCSEVFTNCADVVFAGIDYSSPDPPVEVPKPRPRPRPRPGNGGAGSTSNKCIAKGGWTGQDHMDKWCAINAVCGSDGGETCDCSCSGGGGEPKPEPEPETEKPGHKIEPSEKASKRFRGLEAFCRQNKAYYCNTKRTLDMAPDLCECTPTEPDATPPSPTPSKPDPEPEPETDGDDPADSLSFGKCKAKCQTMCVKRSGGVATNQGWGDPRFIHCKCSDGYEQKFAGCECRHENCPDSMKLAQISTKFGGEVRQKVEIAAHGETLNLD